MEIVILIAAAAAVCAAMLLRGKAWQDFTDRHTHRKEDKKIKAAARCGSLCFVPLMEVKV